MDLALGLRGAVAAVAIFGAGRAMYELKVGQKKHLREEYDFAKQFIDETEKEDLHPYTKEKGYQAVAGSTIAQSHEVEYVLSLKNPVQCLRDFSLSRTLLTDFPKDNSVQDKLLFKEKYGSESKRRWLKRWYLFLYFVLAVVAFLPLIINPGNSLAMSQLLFTLPFGGFYAWMALHAYTKLRRAEHLVGNQEKHTRQVVSEVFEKSA